jgi:hypothetical protein
MDSVCQKPLSFRPLFNDSSHLQAPKAYKNRSILSQCFSVMVNTVILLSIGHYYEITS